MKFYSEICEKLRKGIPYRFSRWGDGEWGCMYGWKGKNRDGNEYLPGLRKELLNIIQSEPDYYIGLQPGVLVDVGRGYVPELREFVMKMLFGHELDLVIGDILHYASEFGYLREFVEVLKNRNVIIIGADYFIDTGYTLIEIPSCDSYSFNNELFRNIDPKHGDVYLVAAAMNSNVIINELPDNVTAIDIGSVFDPYLGKPRATYQHNLKTDWLW